MKRSSRRGGDDDNSLLRNDEVESVPLYLRVAHSLRSRINSGEWPLDTQLPTITDLAAEYRVALVTVRQAVRILAADKLLVSQRGRGTFVTANTRDLTSNTAVRQAINDRLNMPDNCSIEVVRRYEIDDLPKSMLAGGDRHGDYTVIEKVHLENGEPFAFMVIYVRKEIAERIPPGADEREKILKLILGAGGLKLSRNAIQIVLAYADDTMAQLLRCPPLSALVRIRTLRHDTEDAIVLASDAYYRGDKFLFEIEERDIDLAATSPMVFPAIKH